VAVFLLDFSILTVDVEFTFFLSAQAATTLDGCFFIIVMGGLLLLPTSSHPNRRLGWGQYE